MVNFATISQKYSRTLNLFQRQTEGIVLLTDYFTGTQDASKSETEIISVMIRLTDNNVLQRFFEGLGIVGFVEYDLSNRKWGYTIYPYFKSKDFKLDDIEESWCRGKSNPEAHDLMYTKMFEIAENS